MGKRVFHLFADFGDRNPGECGMGGSYIETSDSCEDAIQATLRALAEMPEEIETVDPETGRRVRWDAGRIARWADAR